MKPPPPPFWSAIVCTVCEKREVGPEGVYIARGHVFCTSCADLAENILHSARKRREKARRVA